MAVLHDQTSDALSQDREAHASMVVGQQAGEAKLWSLNRCELVGNAILPQRTDGQCLTKQVRFAQAPAACADFTLCTGRGGIKLDYWCSSRTEARS